MNNCINCLNKDIEIHDLKEEIVRLKKIISSQKMKEKEGIFGSSTPSSKIPLKENTKIDNPNKNGGKKEGDKGYGRKSATEESADKIEYLYYEKDICPECLEKLAKKGYQERTIIDIENNKPKEIIYKCEKKHCPKCRKIYQTKPKVLNNGLYGNNLIAQCCVMHYYHGIPIGRIESILGDYLTSSSLFSIFHKIANILEKSEEYLIEDYRKALVKHADETSWRTDGNSGFAWIFCSNDTTIFQFKNTRGSSVAKAIFGEEELFGVLVVDRYAGYNKIKCKIQYCYAHLLRMVDLGKDSDKEEVISFVSQLSYYLSEAMHLKNLEISDEEYYKKAQIIKNNIIMITESRSNDFGIKNVQEIFIENTNRLYHWAYDRNVPADNNRAERELRPTVVARKVSFGSQSEKGARTRSIIMSYLHTASKRIKDKPLEVWFKEILDKIVQNKDINPYNFLNSVNST